MNFVVNQLQKNVIKYFYIANFLPFPDFLQLMIINKNWFHLLNNDEMWQGRIPNLHSQLSLHRNLLKRESSVNPEYNIREELMKIKKEISEAIDNLYNLKPFEKIEKLNNSWSSIKPVKNEFDKFCESFKIDEHLELLKKEPIKCCIVGAGVIGRTRMCYQMHFGNHDNSEIEKHLTRWQNYHAVYDCEELVRPLYKLILVDTPGPEQDANNMRPLYYDFPQKCQMFVVCYSISSPMKMVEDLEYISRKLIPEIQRFLSLPRSVLLVGTQSDICDVQKENERLGSYWNRYLVEQYNKFGNGLSENIGAAGYVSTSSFEFVGIEELEDLMIKTFVYSKLVEEKQKEKENKKKCLIC